MTSSYELIDQNEFSYEGIGFSFNKYRLEKFVSEEETLMNFFGNNNFKRDDFRKVIRDQKYLKGEFLKVPFDFKQINFNDWHKLSRSEAQEFIWNNFSPYLDKDRQIKKEKFVFEKITKILENSKATNYFILSVDFFDKTYDKDINMKSQKLGTYDAVVYSFYFIVCWFEEKVITIGEFLYD